MPRFGPAYQWRAITVIRGGYGMYYASIGDDYTNSNLSEFLQSRPIQASLDNGLTYIASNANALPNGLIWHLGEAGGLTTNISQDGAFWAIDRQNPYAQRFSLGVQQELPLKFTIEVSCVGNRNTRIRQHSRAVPQHPARPGPGNHPLPGSEFP